MHTLSHSHLPNRPTRQRNMHIVKASSAKKGFWQRRREKKQELRRIYDSVTESLIVEIALKNDGMITPMVLAAHSVLDMTMATKKLGALYWKGLFTYRYDMKNNSYIYTLKNKELFENLSNRMPITEPGSEAVLGKPQSGIPDAIVIQSAVKAKGKLTVAMLSLSVGISVDEAQAKLHELQRKGIFDIDATAEGGLVYLLPDIENYYDILAS